MEEPRQLVFCCPCGSTSVRARGLCARCYRARRLSRKRFRGQRDAVIIRDGGRCVLCGDERIIVHHRDAQIYVTLCVKCHPKIHRTLRPHYKALQGLARELWREQHPNLAEQIEFSFSPPPPRPVQILLFAA